MPSKTEDYSAYRLLVDAYRLLVQEVRDYAIFMLDPGGKVLTWNSGAERLKGYRAEEIIGKHFSIFYTKADLKAQKPQRELETAAVSGRVEDEGWRVRKDGTRFWASVVIDALHDENGELRAFAKVTRDMTERHRTEEALRKQASMLEQRVQNRTAELERANRVLEQANRAKDEFLAALSHELRTPLTSIKGWVQMLHGGTLSVEQNRKALEVIDRNLATQVQLIDDLLDVSRIAAGKLPVEMQSVNPASLIESAVTAIQPLVKAKDLKLTRDLDAGVGPLLLDPSRFHQIVWNLLSNAVKFTLKHGDIRISLKRVGSNAEVQVSDSGEGIDGNFLPHVFDRFRQADNSITRRHGGLGVGLSIVKHLVELQAGTVRAESAGAGKGSTFTLTFPIPALTSTEKVTTAPPDTQGESALSGSRILIVEDDIDTQDMLVRALKLYGASPTVAGSARQAFRLLDEQPCDLIISDIGMPEVDGYAFIRKVRAGRSAACRLPAIALTAYAGKEDRDQAIAAGFDAHVSKPVGIPELVQVIGKAIAINAHERTEE
jgi:PAS domain S-box-containing protein